MSFSKLKFYYRIKRLKCDLISFKLFLKLGISFQKISFKVIEGQTSMKKVTFQAFDFFSLFTNQSLFKRWSLYVYEILNSVTVIGNNNCTILSWKRILHQSTNINDYIFIYFYMWNSWGIITFKWCSWILYLLFKIFIFYRHLYQGFKCSLQSHVVRPCSYMTTLTTCSLSWLFDIFLQKILAEKISLHDVATI